MKAALWCLGKNPVTYLHQGVAEYIKRINHHLPFDCMELSIPPAKKTDDPNRILAMECGMVMKKLMADDYLILLDIRGKDLDSMELSNQLQLWLNHHGGRLVFLIGGAYGFHPDVYARANFRLSFSRLTFNHLLFRLMFVEQLYRACTILGNQPYHH
jgi:23S rRNA (pseudouridine1915-N3)-methyltransferase